MRFSIGRCLLVACAIGAAWLYNIWANFLDDFYRQQIPAEVELAELVYADSGIRGACGAVVFALAPSAKARLRTSGIRALDGAVPDTGPDISDAWKETPYVYRDQESPAESYWALTLSCTWLGKELRETISGALMKPGSFFRRYKEGVTLVIPSGDIVVYLFFD